MNKKNWSCLFSPLIDNNHYAMFLLRYVREGLAWEINLVQLAWGDTKLWHL